MIRPVVRTDLRPLVEIENLCFESDRISPRQFRYMFTKAHATTLVWEEAGQVLGYVLLLYSRCTSTARLYSIAVRPERRGKGIARQLVLAAEAAARDEDRASLRLEIRKDNPASIALFTSLGYRRFGEMAHYYEDDMDALRFEKSLAPHLRPDLVKVPFYEQTTEFTCGPAVLMMAMKTLAPEMILDRKLELRLWREATTIFMTSGHGGCGPYGLALAAAKRGFPVEVHVNDTGVLLVDSVRSEKKKEVMRVVQEDQREELEQLGIPVFHGSLSLDQLQERFNAGCMALVLTSAYQIYEEKFPHWMVITGFDDHFVYVHDPFVWHEQGEVVVDSLNLPIAKARFRRMARWGKAGLQAVVILSQASGS